MKKLLLRDHGMIRYGSFALEENGTRVELHDSYLNRDYWMPAQLRTALAAFSRQLDVGSCQEAAAGALVADLTSEGPKQFIDGANNLLPALKHLFRRRRWR